ncbi:hypothetical protein HXX76_014290 [Chlamydomonas incerta]|uniref:Uncharacterized protein n=1 Tax=Chlamydomonas incerta TaxID=51695 RepID=A0A835SLZ5_CHLIN|nr:hypothetical protein HXX76_014290 [Chlamydomonas incerta]|eukprot:KAG2424714.1 hypothetical protein HXX76_014290 [Chlamydomonas incerta]
MDAVNEQLKQLNDEVNENAKKLWAVLGTDEHRATHRSLRDWLIKRIEGLEGRRNALEETVSSGAVSGSGNRVSTSGAAFSDVSLIIPSYKPDTAPTKYAYNKVTRASLKAILQNSGVVGLVAVSELHAGTPPDEVRLDTLDDVELVDGGTYLGVHLAAPLAQQVEALLAEGWQDSLQVQADPVAAATQHAVTWLQEAGGHAEAGMLCSVKYLRARSGREVEVGGVATANGCAAICEARTKLTFASGGSLAAEMAAIREVAESAEPSALSPLGQLKGSQQPPPVPSGRAVTPNTIDLKQMAGACRQHTIMECGGVRGSGAERSSSGRFQSPVVHPVAGATAGATWSVLRNVMGSSKVLQRLAPRARLMLSQLRRLL